jgi:hypothetical protein
MNNQSAWLSILVPHRHPASPFHGHGHERDATPFLAELHHRAKGIREQVPIRLESIDAPGSFSSGNIGLSDVDPLHGTDREMLAHALKGMGLLEYDGQNGM